MRVYYPTYKAFVFAAAVILFSCDSPVQEYKKQQPDPLSEQLVRANQYMQQRHQDHISAFLERVGWNATETATGLWIVVTKEGEGNGIEEKSRVAYTFSSTLLDGTPCYSANIDSPKMITIGAGGVES